MLKNIIWFFLNKIKLFDKKNLLINLFSNIPKILLKKIMETILRKI